MGINCKYSLMMTSSNPKLQVKFKSCLVSKRKKRWKNQQAPKGSKNEPSKLGAIPKTGFQNVGICTNGLMMNFTVQISNVPKTTMFLALNFNGCMQPALLDENRPFDWFAPTARRVFSVKRAGNKNVTPYLGSAVCSTNGSQTRDKHLVKAGRKHRTLCGRDQSCFQEKHTQTWYPM